MHLRRKRFVYNSIHQGAAVARPKNGGRAVIAAFSVEPLLRVNYHFHCKMSYRLAKPLHLPAGTELQAVAWFDNSRK